MANDLIGKATNIAELALVVGLAYLGYKAWLEFKGLGKGAYDLGGDLGKRVQALEDKEQQDAQYLKWLWMRGGRRLKTGGDSADNPTPVVIPDTPVVPQGDLDDPLKVQERIKQTTDSLKKTDTILNVFDMWSQAEKDVQAGKYGVVDTSPPTQVYSQPGGILSPIKNLWNQFVTTWPKLPLLSESTDKKAKANFMVTGAAPKDAMGADIPLTVLSDKYPEPTVVYNNSIGQRLTLDQVLPVDRVTLDKTPEQQMAAYGALEYKPVPVTLPEPVRQTNNDIYVWVDTVSRSLSTEPIAGRTKMSLQEALSRGY